MEEAPGGCEASDDLTCAWQHHERWKQRLSSSSAMWTVGVSLLAVMLLGGLSLRRRRIKPLATPPSPPPLGWVRRLVDLACAAALLRAMAWGVATGERRSWLMERLVWCDDRPEYSTVLPLVAAWLALVLALERGLGGPGPSAPAPRPPPRDLSFLTPLRGLLSLLVIVHHTTVVYFALARVERSSAMEYAQHFPYPYERLQTFAAQLLWGGGGQIVCIFQDISGRVLLVRYLRNGRKVSDVTRALLTRQLRLGVPLLVTVLACGWMVRHGALAFTNETLMLCRAQSAVFRVAADDLGSLTVRQCLDFVLRLISIRVDEPLPPMSDIYWSIPKQVRSSMLALFAAPFVMQLRCMPLRLAVYAAAWAYCSGLEHDGVGFRPFLLGLVLFEVDEHTTLLRRPRSSFSPSALLLTPTLLLQALRAYLLTITATGQTWFHRGGTTAANPHSRRVEGSFCLLLLLHLTPALPRLLLRCRPLAHMGRWAYSTYLWHHFVMYSLGHATLVLLTRRGLSYVPAVLCTFATVITVSLAVGAMFTALVTRPLDRVLDLLASVVVRGEEEGRDGGQSSKAAGVAVVEEKAASGQ